jgi:hypothetical protein
MSQMRVTNAISFKGGQAPLGAYIPCDVPDRWASGGGLIVRLALRYRPAINVAGRIT